MGQVSHRLKGALCDTAAPPNQAFGHSAQPGQQFAGYAGGGPLQTAVRKKVPRIVLAPVSKFASGRSYPSLVPERLGMKINCTTCAAKYSISDERVAGKSFKIRCKKCSEMIVIRQSVAPEAMLCGQRNENSVLFSLHDLATLPGQVANQGGSKNRATSGRKDGSGLVDIRAMASIYLADQSSPANDASVAGQEADIPSFPQATFHSALPVLLPERAQRAGTRILYTLSGVAAVLLIAASVLLVLVMQGDGTQSRAEAETPPMGAIERIEEPIAVAEAPPAKPTPPPKKSDGKKKTSDKKKKAGARTCDEVTCLVSPKNQCCVLKENKRRARQKALGLIPDLQQKLGRNDIKRGISKVQARIGLCGSLRGGKGTVRLRMKIGGRGQVVTIRATGGAPTLRSCVVSAVMRARFKKTERGMSVNYPIVFR